MIRDIYSFCTEDIGNIKDVSPSRRIYSNFDQHKFSLRKWQMSKVLNLQNEPSISQVVKSFMNEVHVNKLLTIWYSLD